MSDLLTQTIYTFQDSLYFLSNTQTWGAAQTDAQSFQGNLVTINNAAEQTFLAGLFAGKEAWIGYSDAGEEDNFQWVSGENSAYTHWEVGEPNNFRDQDFVILNSQGDWDDVDGTEQNVGIIEISNPTTPIIVAEDLGIIEPYSGSLQANFRVKVVGNSSSPIRVNYSTANGTGSAGNNYQATSGTLVFNPGETEKTVTVTVNQDDDIISGETFFLNLSNPTNAILGDDQAKATIREATDAFTFGNSTYILTNPGNWGEAQEQARTFGGNLVTVNNAREQTILAGTYAGQDLWLGYSDAGDEYDPTTQEGFAWVSGTSAYTNWGGTAPNNFRNQDFTILGENGNWDDVAGTGTFSGIVEIPGQQAIPLADLTTQQIYTYGNSLYLLSNEGNWGQAQAQAQTFQGNLVTINDGAEQTFLAGAFADQSLWTGYSDAGEEGNYQWISGEQSAYTHWKDGAPNNFREQDFALLGPTGTWDDVAGTNEAQGIIEIKNPTVPIFVIEDRGIIEPTVGTRTATFTVRRYGPSSDTATVNYGTANETAQSGTHYVATNGTLRFNPGETQKTIQVTIKADTNTTSGETFAVNLSAPTNAILGTDQAKATLREATEVVTFGNRTYLLTNPGTWGEAQAQAQAFGGNLVTINSASEQAFLAGQYAGESVWIGYSDAGQEYDVTTREGFEWVSGTSAYTNWASGSPNNFRDQDFVILKSDGTWDDVAGAGNFRGIVEIPGVADSPTPTPVPTPTPTPAPVPTPTPTGHIQGLAWTDTNQDGAINAGEVGLSNVRVYLDLNNDGVLNSGEPLQVTASDLPNTSQNEAGEYRFDNLAPGTYTVRAVLPNGLQPTTALSRTVQVGGGQGVSNINFGSASIPSPPLSSNPKIIGTKKGDRLTGDSGKNRIVGKKGKDKLFGLDGDDLLLGGLDNDRLKGGNGNDRLKGDKGNDKLFGNAGRDQLIGGKGKDKVIGGDGVDVFILSKGSGFDQIQDFKNGQDLLDLPKKLGFRDLTLEQKGRNLIVSDGSDQLAILKGVRENQITRADFA